MRRLCLGLLIVLALAKPYVGASYNSGVNTAREFIDSSWKISDTIEKAAAFAKQLKFMGGALGLLASFGSDSGHRQVMDEFAKVHKGMAKLEDQISFLEANIELQHLETRLFNAFEVLRQAMRLSSLGQQTGKYCDRNQCYHKLEQLTHHAPELLKAYINAIGPKEDYVPLVAAYAHRLISIVGNSDIIVELSMKDVNKAYIGQEEMISEITSLLEKSKSCWSKISANIRLDATALMQQGRRHSTHDVLLTLRKGLKPKFPWMSLAILVYNDIWSFDRHYITGHRVDVFHESGKNVVVFVKNKGYDSFKGGKIGEDKCRDKCLYKWPFRRGPKPASQCRVYEGGVYGTATIKRYEGLWYSIPSDYNYCISNNKYFTNFAMTK